MAELLIKKKKIIRNIEKVSTILESNSIDWTLIVKILSGHKKILSEIIQNPIIKRLNSLGDSRLTGLRCIKEINPDIETMYIKPPAIKYIPSVVEYADISLNSSFETIEALNQEARTRNKIHKIIIMIEMGELREGVIRENILEFYDKVFEFSNIKIIGLGTNLGCMYGVEPTYDKLIQLSLYKQLLEARFNRKLALISGGSSITLPLVMRKKIPIAINHFRVGEAVFLGTSPFNNKKFDGLSTDIFELNANIIEVEKKEITPSGSISEGYVGHTGSVNYPENVNKSYRAIVDFGVLDVDVKNIKPQDKNISFLGTTSDMTVFDLGLNRNKSTSTDKYKVGDKLNFFPNYMAVARLMNSKYITKRIL